MLDDARVIVGWSVRDVLDYLHGHSADVLDYPPDADADTMRVCDDENRARAVVYRAGCAVMPRTLDAAGRAIEFVKSR
jgi:hypothetical protein